MFFFGGGTTFITSTMSTNLQEPFDVFKLLLYTLFLSVNVGALSFLGPKTTIVAPFSVHMQMTDDVFPMRFP